MSAAAVDGDPRRGARALNCERLTADDAGQGAGEKRDCTGQTTLKNDPVVVSATGGAVRVFWLLALVIAWRRLHSVEVPGSSFVFTVIIAARAAEAMVSAIAAMITVSTPRGAPRLFRSPAGFDLYRGMASTCPPWGTAPHRDRRRLLQPWPTYGRILKSTNSKQALGYKFCLNSRWRPREARARGNTGGGIASGERSTGDKAARRPSLWFSRALRPGRPSAARGLQGDQYARARCVGPMDR